MTRDIFVRGALHVYHFLDGFWKDNSGFKITFHINYFSVMHRFRHRLMFQTGIAVLTISPLARTRINKNCISHFRQNYSTEHRQHWPIYIQAKWHVRYMHYAGINWQRWTEQSEYWRIISTILPSIKHLISPTKIKYPSLVWATCRYRASVAYSTGHSTNWTFTVIINPF